MRLQCVCSPAQEVEVPASTSKLSKTQSPLIKKNRLHVCSTVFGFDLGRQREDGEAEKERDKNKRE